ncbi:MAG: enoyl-CoA hydratase/isomerase family protein [Planctomycetota bacterium]
MSTYEFFELQMSDGLAVITLNRPPLNVLHIPMMAEFNALLETVLGEKREDEPPGEPNKAARQEPRPPQPRPPQPRSPGVTDLAAVVLRAEGKVFSAGVDVSDHTADKVGEMIRQFHGIFRKLAGTDALTIAVVHGAALGGGCELATFCDIVLASDRAKFGQPEVQVGVFPPIAACVLPFRVGINKAIELNGTGRVIEAQEAHRIGLVDHVFPAGEFEARVERYLDDLRKLSRPVVRMAKRATTMMVRKPFLEQLEQVERMYLDELMKLADAHEGIAAFVGKRPPSWKHA